LNSNWLVILGIDLVNFGYVLLILKGLKYGFISINEIEISFKH